MCVVGRGYGGLGGGMDGGGGWYACRTKRGWLATCREMPDHLPSIRLYTDDSQSYRHPGAQLLVAIGRSS